MIALNGHKLSLAEVWHIASLQSACELAPAALPLIRRSRELVEWVDGGAHVYVCGDATRMAKDVDAALHHIAETAGGLTKEAAAEYIQKLKSEKRYQRDVY